MPTRFRARSLVLVVLLTAATAMVYQFSVVSALIFIMGDSILLFSVFTGVFLLSMGVGSVLGARPTAAMDISFIRVQFSLAALGLAALPLVFCLFAASEYARRRGITLPQPAVVFTFWANGLLIDFLFGVLTGMQLPLLAGLFRTLRLQDRSLASLLGFDYLGSFVGALAFPLSAVERAARATAVALHLDGGSAGRARPRRLPYESHPRTRRRLLRLWRSLAAPTPSA